MNWIKQNTFLAGLAVVTLVAAIVLWIFGNGAAGRYEEAKKDYDEAFAEAKRFEELDPYPNAELLESKKISVEAYGEQTDELQKAFAPYRPENLENITVQAFSSAVKKSNRETRSAFGENTKVPEAYFCGFEVYRTALPPGDATGILNYQLEVTKKIMLNLAEAGVTELVSLHRPKLPEEEGKRFEADDEQVARALPLEIVFKGREPAVRQFLSSLVNDKENHLIVRSIKVANEKLIPPRKTDARFEGAPNRRPGGGAASANAAPDFSALFGGIDQPAPAELEQPEGEAPAPAPEPEREPVPGDSSRILAQVLGNEEIQVFIRLDILLFLQPKDLP